MEFSLFRMSIRALVGTTALSCLFAVHPASGQEAAQGVGRTPAEFNDIVVTARKREESSLSAPVTIAAVSGQQLNARGITTLEGIARTIPQLIIGDAAGSFQGGAIGLRGISAGDGNVFGDQAVAFNIDGVQVARSTPRRLSEMDLAQVEVLKGPQALFFGKNSPGGIVVLRSADPTASFEAKASGAYEFNAREWRGEGYVSTPLTDALGLRVAVMGTRMRGWVDNISTPGTIYEPRDRTEPSNREFGGRVTFKYDDGGPFTARFKFTYGYLKNNGFAANAQRVACPAGFAQGGGPDDCTPDDRVVRAYAGLRFGSGGINTVTGATIVGVPLFGDGQYYGKVRQYLSGLQLNYNVSDTISITSMTGLYQSAIRLQDNFNGADTTFAFNPAAGPAGLGGALIVHADLDTREISQEIRLTSSFDGPADFMIGGYFQDQKLEQVTAAAFNALNPVQLYPPLHNMQDGTAYSVFGSVSLKPLDTVEISGGARYSHERKEIAFYRVYPGALPASAGGGAYSAGELVPTAVPKVSFQNVSPELTVTWRPDSRHTAYFGWKRGFLSGGFNPTGTGTGVRLIGDRSYDQEIVEGFEGGLKGILLNGMIRVNLAVYDYKISGLQVTSTVASTGGQSIDNAASARTKGFEIDGTFSTPVEGLSLNGAIAYSRARYNRFQTSPCYGGQSIAAGCSLGFLSTRFTQQDLTGQPLVRAPDWGAAIGANYEHRDAKGNVYGVATGANYTSSQFTEATNSPGSVQSGYWLLDASARFETATGIELALIGRNLTNKYYFSRTSDATLTGFGAGTTNALRSDTQAAISRGREVIVRLSVKFGER